jgi:hypothetical protein
VPFATNLLPTASSGVTKPSRSTAALFTKVEDAVFGNHAALACHMANESYFRNGAVSLDAATKAIRG